MLCACIDIGSNTTRVLVADVEDGALREVLQRRAFTRIGKGLKGGEIPREKIDEVARVVAEQRQLIEQLGTDAMRVVATAAIRGAANQDEFAAAMRAVGGVEVEILDGEEEARLAFLGATRTLGQPLDGTVGVVDVGGGSTELAIGTRARGRDLVGVLPRRLGPAHRRLPALGPALGRPTCTRCASTRKGCSRASRCPRSTPRSRSAAARRRCAGSWGRCSTRSRCSGRCGCSRAIRSEEVSRQFAIDRERVVLMAAGLTVLDAAAQALGRPLQIGRGGLREGILLELAAR